MFQKPIDPHAFIAAHAAGMKNQQLADLFGVHVSTVKRHKQRLALSSNDRRNTIGKQGERLVAQELTRHGFQVALMETGHEFDLLADGHRVEVKASLTQVDGGHRFRLNTERSSNHDQYRYHKDYRRDSDFIALAVLNIDGIEHLYILPSELWKPSIRVYPDSPFCPYASYRWALQLLRKAAA